MGSLYLFKYLLEFTSKPGGESLDFPGKRGATNHTIPRGLFILAAWVGGMDRKREEIAEEEVHGEKINEKLGKMLFILSSDWSTHFYYDVTVQI